MLPLSLFSRAGGLCVDQLVINPSAITFFLRTTGATALCPSCDHPSDYIHSRYTRRVLDLPIFDHTVTFRLTARKFFCRNTECSQSVFCERLDDLLSARARTTDRLTQTHRSLGFALGGEAGARMANQLSMPTSPDTLLRRVKDATNQSAPPPRFVGVDDWSLRKGQTYGTILVDLERGRVIDILPGRDGEALKQWLKEHPSVEVISRDRWDAYTQAATEGAPEAQQVADRWHLLKNLREAVERLLERQYGVVKKVLLTANTLPSELSPGSDHVPEPTLPEGVDLTLASQGKAVQESAGEQVRKTKRQQRGELFQRVRELHQQGRSIREIAKELALSRQTVRRFLRSEQLPDWQLTRPRRTQLDSYKDYIDRRWQEGCRNAAELHRELVGQGLQASYDAVRRYLARHLGSARRPGPRVGPLSPTAVPALPSARRLSFEFLRKPEKRKEEEQARLDKLRECASPLREGLDLATEFMELVRQPGKGTLAKWLAKVEESSCGELRSFAAGLRSDEAAVAAGLTLKWSNGPVEGQVNRLKVIKRQMYGRASFQLLRARVLNAG